MMSRTRIIRIPIEYAALLGKLETKDLLKLKSSPFGGRNPFPELATPYTNRKNGTVLIKECGFSTVKKTTKHIFVELLD